MTSRRTVATPISETPGYRYSTPAFVVPPGPTMFIQGQVAWDADRNIIGVGNFEEQTRQVFRNLQSILATEGGSLFDLVHMVIFVTDISRAEDFVKVRNEFYGDEPLTPSTIVEVAALMAADMEIEIHATAVLGRAAPGSSDA